ncbi:ewing's tumor-associated antigen 1 [Scophthalmus maximus]|uniref:Ewing's tumor-associated antigen 1-like n=1 Tax=Scophthalmus maximus TaxID=52904 RepID=A0A6A4SPB8_SCOMX|nr:ewing's tumor-associated antigen 1 [Scophthalmus maximus]KAF0036956.1 hypothetical protein F2P81_009830 [Scophthalmus maximus]
MDRRPAPLVRASRLSRSSVPVGVGCGRSQQTDFRSPTRIPRSRVSTGFNVESPHNESDCQSDIVWDAASPSPLRPGKRGRRAPTGAASISEIVSRIAPKHGRPEVTEPTLQQWIGDNAAIPCTPTVQVPKPRKKSPRTSGVDDLLKLARQFDFNMFRQDEDELDDMHQQSLELLSEDILDFENGDQIDLSPPSAAAGTDAAVVMDHHTESDLDALFDGPTQRVSGCLSQVSSQVKPAVISPPREASGKKPAAVCSGAANDAFEDDWDDDDLLSDPLVLEMTQSPQRFAAPRHQSTQKPAGGVKHRSAANAPACGGAGLGRQSAASTAETGSVRQRATFKLLSSPDAFLRTNLRADYSRRRAEGVAEQSRVSNSRDTGSNTESDQRKRTTGTSFSSASSATTSTLGFPKKPHVVLSHMGPTAVSDDPDDLDALFSSDPVWDDPADDDLLCEMCDNMENQIRSSYDTSSKQTPPSNQNAALQLANQQPVLHKQTPAARPGGQAGVTAGPQVDMTRDSFRFTQTKSSSGSTCSLESTVQSALAAPRNEDRVDFRIPTDPASPWTNTARCSAAEIELKKQQAMERRRRRLQASQNLRAPT